MKKLTDEWIGGNLFFHHVTKYPEWRKFVIASSDLSGRGDPSLTAFVTQSAWIATSLCASQWRSGYKGVPDIGLTAQTELKILTKSKRCPNLHHLLFVLSPEDHLPPVLPTEDEAAPCPLLHYQLSTVNCQLSTINYPLFILHLYFFSGLNSVL